MTYPTATGRSIEEIAAHAAEYAAGRGDDAGAGSSVISVAVVQVVGPMSPAYSATQSMVGDFMRGRLTGASLATWSLENFHHTDKHRSEHAARVRAIADVIDSSGVRVDCLAVCSRELRAYAEVYEPLH